MSDESSNRRGIQCPECKIALPDFELDSHQTLNFCGRCKGTWFDPGELASETGGTVDLPDLKFSLNGAKPASQICPRCHLSLFKIPYLAGQEISLEYCKHCLGIWAQAGQIAELRRLRAGVRRPFAETSPSAVSSPAHVPSELRFDSESLRVNCLAIPLSILFYYLAIHLISFAPWFLIPLQFHELGHAVHAWMGSRLALPAFYGETVWSLHPSFGNYFLSLIVNGLLITWCAKQKTFYPVALSISYVLIQTALTLFVSEQRREGMAVYGGFGGQIWLSCLVILSFYYSFPDKIRWDFWRFPALGLGVFSLCDAVSLWFGIAAGSRTLPRGSLLQGGADKNGDIDRLIAHWGWSEEGLVQHYLNLTKLGLLLVLGHYLYFGYVSWKKLQRRKS